jgi:probable rRNA maturation factor
MSKDKPSPDFIVDIQHHHAPQTTQLPEDSLLQRWTCAVLMHEQLPAAELTLRLVDEVEMQQLNVRYRGKNKPTNVLSFPANIPDGIELDIPLLGDIILCVPVIEREAREQQKVLFAHWAHMVMHGVLHLLGYDHQDDKAADIMETKEIYLLQQCHYPNPYNET